MTNSERVCVIIPAYNEEETLPDVLHLVKKNAPTAGVVVMNDGSHDATSLVAHEHGVPVLDLPINLGIGGAVQTGIKYAYRHGYDVAIELDGDGQHDPKHIPELLSAVRKDGGPDVAIGSRFVQNSDYRASLMRQFGIHLFSFLIHLVTGKRIYDSTSGYRAYNRRAMQFLQSEYPADFPEPESIVMLLVNGYRISEVPVEMHERQGGESVVQSDISWRAVYFVVSNAIAIVLTGLSTRYGSAR